jgi:hypothetical protein
VIATTSGRRGTQTLADYPRLLRQLDDARLHPELGQGPASISGEYPIVMNDRRRDDHRIQHRQPAWGDSSTKQPSTKPSGGLDDPLGEVDSLEAVLRISAASRDWRSPLAYGAIIDSLQVMLRIFGLGSRDSRATLWAW